MGKRTEPAQTKFGVRWQSASGDGALGWRGAPGKVDSAACDPGDIFLLCTDGLVEGLYDTHIEEFLRSPESTRPGASPATRLVEESVARNGHDNTTALVIRVA